MNKALTKLGLISLALLPSLAMAVLPWRTRPITHL
ncbi:Ammonia transporter|nr:Ammonia transporter [Candidatus Pantoea persica]